MAAKTLKMTAALAIVGLLASCGDPAQGPGVGGGPQDLPDGFVVGGCASESDCDDVDPCTDDRCEPGGKSCSHTAKSCDASGDVCNLGVCDARDGTCLAKPAHESMSCTTPSGVPGQCLTGVCTAVPRCVLDSEELDCASFNQSTAGTTSGPSVLDSYTCAGAFGLTGPEYGYPFSVTTDRDVTLSLTGAAADFDLLVLEGSACTALAKCAAAALTIGSGSETLDFHAVGGKDYVIVVDGRGGAKGSFTLGISCSGSCKPIQTLACNQSVMGDTTGPNATQVVSSYSCNPSTPGPEDTYLVMPAIDTQFRMKLTQLTTDLDMMVTYADDGGECDPTACKASLNQTGTTDEEVPWTAFGGYTYTVIIDSKMAGQGGPYLLEVGCAAECANSANKFLCSSPSDARRNDDPGRSRDVVDGWSCAPDTTGPEVVYHFVPPDDGLYTFELTGLGADLDLIVLESTNTTCDSSQACLQHSTRAGPADESVSFIADSGNDYFIAVDGKHGAVSSYTLKMTTTLCP